MKRIRPRLIAPLLFLLVAGIAALPWPAAGAPIHLRGLAELEIVVEALPEEFRSNGLRQHLIQDEIGSRLEAAGVRVADNPSSRLVVSIKSLQARNDGFTVFQLKLQLVEPSILLRDVQESLQSDPPMEGLPSLSFGLISWESSSFGYIRQYADPLPVLHEALTGKVDQFLSDWRMAQQELPGEMAPPTLATQVEPVSPEKRNITIRSEGDDLVIFDSLGGEIFRREASPLAPSPKNPVNPPEAAPSTQEELLRSLFR